MNITPFSRNFPNRAITPHTFYLAKQSAQVKTWPSLDFYEIRPNLSCKRTLSMCSAVHIKLGTSLTSSCASSASPFVFSLEKISRHRIAEIVLGGQITCLSRSTLKTRPGKGKSELLEFAALMLTHKNYWKRINFIWKMKDFTFFWKAKSRTALWKDETSPQEACRSKKKSSKRGR